MIPKFIQRLLNRRNKLIVENYKRGYRQGTNVLEAGSNTPVDLETYYTTNYDKSLYDDWDNNPFILGLHDAIRDFPKGKWMPPLDDTQWYLRERNKYLNKYLHE